MMHYVILRVSCIHRTMVDLCLNAGAVNHGPRIRDESAHRTSDVSVHFHDLLDGRRLNERRRDTLLYGQHDAFGGFQANCGRAELRRATSESSMQKAGGGRHYRWHGMFTVLRMKKS